MDRVRVQLLGVPPRIDSPALADLAGKLSQGKLRGEELEEFGFLLFHFQAIAFARIVMA